MADSAPTTPIKVKKAAAPKTSSSKKSSSGPSYCEMVLNAITELTQGKAKGVSYSGLSHYVKREYEFGKTNEKRITTFIRAAVSKLMESGEIVVSDGTHLNNYRLRLNDELRKKMRDAAKNQEKVDAKSPVKPKVSKKATSETKSKKAAAIKKTPTKKQTKKTTTTPKKPAAKKTPKKATKTQTPKKVAAKTKA